MVWQHVDLLLNNVAARLWQGIQTKNDLTNLDRIKSRAHSLFTKHTAYIGQQTSNDEVELIQN